MNGTLSSFDFIVLAYTFVLGLNVLFTKQSVLTLMPYCRSYQILHYYTNGAKMNMLSFWDKYIIFSKQAKSFGQEQLRFILSDNMHVFVQCCDKREG